MTSSKLTGGIGETVAGLYEMSGLLGHAEQKNGKDLDEGREKGSLGEAERYIKAWRREKGSKGSP